MYEKMREGGRDVSDGEAKFEMTKKIMRSAGTNSKQKEDMDLQQSRNSGIIHPKFWLSFKSSNEDCRDHQ